MHIVLKIYKELRCETKKVHIILNILNELEAHNSIEI